MNATGSAKLSLLPYRKQNGLKALIAAAALAAPLALGACASVPYPPPHKTLKAQQAAATQTEETARPAAAETESPETAAEQETRTTPSWPALSAAEPVASADAQPPASTTTMASDAKTPVGEPRNASAGIMGWLDGVMAGNRDATSTTSPNAATATTETPKQEPVAVAPAEDSAQPLAERTANLSVEEEPAEEDESAGLAPAEDRGAAPARSIAGRSLGKRFATPLVAETPTNEEAEPLMPPPDLDQAAHDQPDSDQAESKPEMAPVAPVASLPLEVPAELADAEIGEIEQLSPAAGQTTTVEVPQPPVAEAEVAEAQVNETEVDEVEVDETEVVEAEQTEAINAEASETASNVFESWLTRVIEGDSDTTAEAVRLEEAVESEEAVEADEVETAEIETAETETTETNVTEPESVEPSAAGLDMVEPAAGEQMAAKSTGHELGARIVFESDSAVLTPEAQAELSALASTLMAQQNSKVMILGYSGGAEGGDEAARARVLSLSRSMAVRRFLMVRGLPSNRLVARALGSQVAEGPSDRVDVMVGQL